MFHCNLLSHASSATSLRPHRAEIEGNREEHAVDFTLDIKINSCPRRKGSYFRFLTHFVSFAIPEWMLLEQVDECERLSIFLSSEKRKRFSMGQDFFNFLINIQQEMPLFTKTTFFYFFITF